MVGSINKMEDDVYIIDHDYHIHTYLSYCSNDFKQNIDNIVKNCKRLGYKAIAITDHGWDDKLFNDANFYIGQNIEHVIKDRPYKKYKNIKIYYGIEAEVDRNNVLGLTKEAMELFDHINISTTHFHVSLDPYMNLDNKERSIKWLERLDAILNMDLPFYKIGISHLTTVLISKGNKEDLKEILNYLSDENLHKIFKKCATKGVGIELNFNPDDYTKEQLKAILRIFKIAKNEHCKFYLGGDEHHLDAFNIKNEGFKKIIKLLDLKEKDKYIK